MYTSEYDPSPQMTMLDAPGAIASPPVAVAVQVPTNVLQSAVALNVPPWANEAVYLKRSAAGTVPLDTGSRVVNAVSCQLVPTRSPPGGGVGAGVGDGVGAGVGVGVGVGGGVGAGVAVGVAVGPELGADDPAGVGEGV